jgi:hypothetical protein
MLYGPLVGLAAGGSLLRIAAQLKRQPAGGVVDA